MDKIGWCIISPDAADSADSTHYTLEIEAQCEIYFDEAACFIEGDEKTVQLFRKNVLVAYFGDDLGEQLTDNVHIQKLIEDEE